MTRAASDFSPTPPPFDISVRLNATSIDGKSLAATIGQLAARREPAVLRGTLVSSWPALRSWHQKGLCERVPVFGGPVFLGNDSLFYHEHRDPSKKPWVRLEEPLRTPLNMTCAEFIAALDEQGARHPYMYVSAPLRGAMADLPSLDQLLVPEVVARAGSTNLWLGRGVTAAMHYDGHHNIFVQLIGRKKFLLAPPAAALQLRLFPEPHPRDRHAQPRRPATSGTCIEHLEEVDARHADDRSNGRQAPVWTSEAVLDPGDVLYLPPYHFHRVEALPSALRCAVSPSGFSSFATDPVPGRA